MQVKKRGLILVLNVEAREQNWLLPIAILMPSRKRQFYRPPAAPRPTADCKIHGNTQVEKKGLILVLNVEARERDWLLPIDIEMTSHRRQFSGTRHIGAGHTVSAEDGWSSWLRSCRAFTDDEAVEVAWSEQRVL
ncbi:hypothetical protein MRB53_026213 [Persea americana]|uniref:Uncharacterized protein n=1 Tax=Persea americana TaxID=3435 RepID=A0ACC2LHC6_PERAE|nr:hypothetical protein MRB53_026213 [Persea americana]